MPAPATPDEFITLVEKSRLLAADALDDYRLRAAVEPTAPRRLASWMVADGRLTQFQAELLLAGKYRPFFVGPYKVLTRIGNGSMGVVYLCEHREMRRKVAVKILQSRRATDVVAFQRFMREARAAASLNHPNVVHALDLGFEEGLHYLSMEYIDGVSLKELVRKEGPVPPRQVAEYLRQAALGVQHAHESGLIHRDIKPSNLMIDHEGVVKLLDLGLALFADSEEELTRGTRLGNVAYAAPEQVRDSHTVDARADIYSLGATFYFAATGLYPNPGAGIGDTQRLWKNSQDDFAKLMSILQRMTTPNPDDRYQTAADVVAAVVGWAPAPQPKSAPTVDMDPPLAVPVHDEEPLAPSVPDITPPPPVSLAERVIKSPTPPAQPGLPAPPPPAPAPEAPNDDFAFETQPLRRGPVVRKKSAKSTPAANATPAADAAKAAISAKVAKPAEIKPAPAPKAASWVRRWRWPVTLGAAAVVGLLLAITVRAMKSDDPPPQPASVPKDAR